MVRKDQQVPKIKVNIPGESDNCVTVANALKPLTQAAVEDSICPEKMTTDLSNC